MSENKVQEKRQRRRRAHFRVRGRIQGAAERPRLAVYKSAKYIYAQVIDDSRGHTLAQANSREAEVLNGLENGGSATIHAARRVGELVARRAMDQGIERVVFDRGGYIYHGKVKAVAEGAREKGLKF